VFLQKFPDLITMPMRLPFSVIPSVSTLSRACCLLATSALIGCATKNPLMEEPVATAPSAQPAPADKPASPATAKAPANVVTPASAAAPAQAAPAATAQAAQSQPQPTKAAEPAVSGVQTTQAKRLFGIFSPYRIDVQQGNFISQEQLAQLKVGMTPDQVKFVLGTPLLNDVFHANRWDYVFRLQKGSGEIISSRIAVHFQDNRVAKIDAGTLPGEREYLSLIAGTTPDAPKAGASKTEKSTK
jgi:outer membrane protein assembly factor BamE